jgi:hypothetical protein
MTIETMKLALEALEGVLDDSPKVLDASISGGLYEVVQCRDAITALRTAIEQAEKQEPAPGYCKHCKQYTIEEPLPAAPLQDAQPLRGAMPWEQLYPQFERATPPAAQRQPLTDEQIDAGVAAWFATETVVGGRPFEKRMRAAIEAAHGVKETNT